MPKKKPPKPRPKAGLTQKERFLEAAKKAESDETGAEFERAMRMLVKPKKAS
jgi:hypothetical protein